MRDIDQIFLYDVIKGAFYLLLPDKIDSFPTGVNGRSI